MYNTLCCQKTIYKWEGQYVEVTEIYIEKEIFTDQLFWKPSHIIY